MVGGRGEGCGGNVLIWLVSKGEKKEGREIVREGGLGRGERGGCLVFGLGAGF